MKKHNFKTGKPSLNEMIELNEQGSSPVSIEINYRLTALMVKKFLE